MQNLRIIKSFYYFLLYMIIISPFVSTIAYAGKLSSQKEDNLWSAQAGKFASSDKTKKKNLLSAYKKPPLFFIKNEGQIDEKVKFYLKGASYTIFFTENEVVYSFKSNNNTIRDRNMDIGPKGGEIQSVSQSNGWGGKSQVVSQKFLGANTGKSVKLHARKELPEKINYFLGKDPRKWKMAVSTYSEIVYQNLYQGIDLKYNVAEGMIKYEFLVRPGADYRMIQLGLKGTEGPLLDDNGDMVIKTSLGELRDIKPISYQEIDGKRIGVESRFKIRDKGTNGRLVYGFEIKGYNPSYALIIDPTLSFSTYLGGSSGEGGLWSTKECIYNPYGGGECIEIWFQKTGGMSIDSSGNTYVTSRTDSTDFPTQGPHQGTNAGGWDALIAKFNPSGQLLFSTYLGGSDRDVGFGIAVGLSGNIYVAGSTRSTDFPTLGPYQSSNAGGWDAFIATFSPSGQLVFSTYLGGSGWDESLGIAVDSSENVYVTGFARSTDFPTLNPYQALKAGRVDVFIATFSPSGQLVFSTYLGGTGSDVGWDIAVEDSSGNAFVTGSTESNNFPTLNPYQGFKAGDDDAFIAKFSPSGQLLFSSYFGGTDNDVGYGIAVEDPSGNAYMTGSTWSTDLPTLDPYQGSKAGYRDVFIAELSPSGQLLFSTYLGGNGSDGGLGIALDKSGNAFVTGYTYSTDFPTLDPYQGSNAGGSHVFIAELSPSGQLLFSTYLGGNGADVGWDIAVESSGNIHVAGFTGSTDFPTLNPYQGSKAGSFDVFVTRLSLDLVPCVQGDCNGDSEVTTADVTCTILRIFDVIPQVSPCEDCNGDGKLTTADVTCCILCNFDLCP